jgi:GDPmannose 4,6-dehydratase
MRILITGLNGQDGSILADKHLNNGDEVWGSVSPGKLVQDPRCNAINTPLGENFQTTKKVFDEIRPDRIYHLAARHFSSNHDLPLTPSIMNEMHNCHVVITRNILEWQILNPTSRSLIALTSQMYLPKNEIYIINEQTPCEPQNYYAETKCAAKELLHFYRKNHRVRAYGAILFNHTSLRSRPDFLFPYLAHEITKLIGGKSTEIPLRDPSALLDISHADEVCEGIYKLLGHEIACDLVFASGKLVRIDELIEKTLRLLDFKGKYSVTKSDNYPANLSFIMGDASLAEKLINWKVKLSPEEILREQVLKVVTN